MPVKILDKYILVCVRHEEAYEKAADQIVHTFQHNFTHVWKRVLSLTCVGKMLSCSDGWLVGSGVVKNRFGCLHKINNLTTHPFLLQ